MKPWLEQNRYVLYNIFLWIFLFSLPVTEGIKQISLFILTFLGFFIAYKENTKFQLDLINLGLIVFVIFTIFGAIINQSPIKNTLDPLRCALFFFSVRLIDIEKINLKTAFYALFLGFLTAFTMGCFVKFSAEDPMQYFKLKSIGHVNHSSIYMLLIFCFSLINITNKNKLLRFFSYLVAAISLIGIIITGSRATMYLAPFIITSTTIYYLLKSEISYKNAFLMILGLAIVSILTIYLIPDERIYYKVTKGILTNESRIPIFYSAFYTWQENPFFGIGSGEFKSIDMTKFFPENWGKNVSHAHNTFLTFLAEKGIIALCGYLIFELGLFIKFIKNMKSSVIIFLAFSILIFQNVISLANTTFHHENALLMLFIWALALNQIKAKQI